MDKDRLQPLVDQIAEEIVLADPDDLQALAGLHTLFNDFAAACEEDAPSELRRAAGAAAEQVEKLVLAETDDPEATRLVLERTVTAFQFLIRDNYTIREVVFPAELGVERDGDAKDAVATAPADEASVEIESTEEGRTESDENAEETEPPAKSTDDGMDSTSANDEDNPELSPPAAVDAGDVDPAETEEIVNSVVNAVNSEPELLADFIGESNEHLDNCNEYLLTLESAPGDEETLNAVFRAFHSIKGVAGFLNLTAVRELSHKSENLLDKARSKELTLDDVVMDVIFSSVDTLRNMLTDLAESLKSGEPVIKVTSVSTLVARIVAVIGEEGAEPAPTPKAKATPPVAKEPTATPADIPFEIIASEMPRFVTEVNDHLDNSNELLLTLEKDPDDEEVLDGLFRCFHSIKGDSGFLALDKFETLAHSAENLLGLARNKELKLTGNCVDLIFETIDEFRTMSKKLEASVNKGGVDYATDKYSELIARLDGLSGPKTTATAIVAPTLGPTAAPTATASRKAVLKETVKVDSDRLDKLVDTIGELVIAESMISQSEEIRQFASPVVMRRLGQLDKITRELQEMGMSLRMVPLRSTFQKMARVVRDLTRKESKEVDFVMEGEDTELDKTVVDKIGDPLVHMVRNAVDHGIEPSSEDRVAAGKPAKATVKLRAYHKGGNIYIEISDDGRGLNRKAILGKAAERGLISGDDDLPDREVWQLIFAPGFSTAAQVTEVSGRGVGMDVVKRNIEALRGQVEITSEPGKGSVFSIRLPLTLAIIDGMVVKVASERYIIPTLSIETSLHVKRKDISTIQNRGEMVKLQGELIPVYHLDRLFDGARAQDDTEEVLVVVVEDEGRKTGVVIEEILGQQQIVIKNLGGYLKKLQGFSGGAIMPDGSVGLILDVESVVRLAETHVSS